MKNISELKPEKVFDFFRQISEIPHGSGNTEQIAQYCLDFAKERNLKAVKDLGGNVIIYADGTNGYENSEPVIIQGHLDMVCEKTPDCTKDMEKEGLTLCTDGEYLWAEGTTLGGDDGIAIAYILALLDSDNIPHPPIEAVITRDEETGMYGAADFEAHLVKGKKILNIDSEEEGVLTVSCAGGITAHCEIPYEASKAEMNFAYEISVGGLTGGHSGADIHKNRKNASKVLGQLLGKLYNSVDFLISTIEGGGKTNVIPQNAKAILGCASDCSEIITKIVDDFSKDFTLKNAENEPSAVFTVKAVSADCGYANETSTKMILEFFADAPDGVQSMSAEMEGIVQTSLNLGILAIGNSKIVADFLIRSNSADEKKFTAQKVADFTSKLGGTAELGSDYPAWEYREKSPLRDTMTAVYRDMYGKEPIVTAIHAGLECGIFSEKIADADIVSFGPDNENIHTPNERLNVASAERCWEYLKEVLKRCK